MADSEGARLRSLVYDDVRDRPRTPWRLAVGVVVVLLVGAVGAILGSRLDALAADATDPALRTVAGTATQTVTTLSVAVGVVVASRLVDRRPVRGLGLDRSRAWVADLGFGLALGVALPAGVFALELLAGYVRVTGTLRTRPSASLSIAPTVSPWLALALVFAYFVAVGVFEELLFRAYLLVNVAEGLAWFDAIDERGALLGAAGATSTLFGIVHGLNPNATGLAVLVICSYGGFLAATVLLTGRLAVAVGLHVAWNFAVSSIFGFPVSGFTTPVTLVAVEQSGPAVVTGGRFGPEGGLVALVGLAVAAGTLVWWVRRREGELRIQWPDPDG